MHPIAWFIAFCWMVCYIPTLTAIVFTGVVIWGTCQFLRGLFRI